MPDFTNAPWFLWAIGIAAGLPLTLVVLTEWQHSLRRRGSALLRPVTLLRNYLLPFGALLMLMVGATQMPADSQPVRIVGTLVAIVVLILVLSGMKAALFQSAPDGTWRRRIPGIFVDVIRFGLIAVGIAMIMSYIWGANVGGLFTALGITSIVIGLALQNSVGQIISGLLMLFEQPFRLGDWIENRTKTLRGRIVEVNWRSVHLETGGGLQVIPNSVLAADSFTNLSRPEGRFLMAVDTVFATEDRPDQVCSMLTRVAAQLPQCHPDLTPTAVPIGGLKYRTKIPLRSPGDDGAEAVFLRWIWYAARREGLHLDEAEDGFSDPGSVAAAISAVVAPLLGLGDQEQQRMVRSARLERYGAGELIEAAGKVPDAICFVLSGVVAINAQLADGELGEVATRERGSFIGGSALIRQPATASCQALDEVALVRVEREAVEAVVRHNPQLLQELGRSIAETRAMGVAASVDSPAEDTAAR